MLAKDVMHGRVITVKMGDQRNAKSLAGIHCPNCRRAVLCECYLGIGLPECLDVCSRCFTLEPGACDHPPCLMSKTLVQGQYALLTNRRAPTVHEQDARGQMFNMVADKGFGWGRWIIDDYAELPLVGLIGR